MDIPEYNEAAITMFSKLGFIHEGILRKSHPHAGKRFDSSIMGMLASEYLKRISKTEPQKIDEHLTIDNQVI